MGTGGNQEREVSVWRRLIHDRRIPHGAFRFWHYLHDRRNHAGEAHPSVLTIRHDLGVNSDSLDGWEKALVECGYLAIEKRGKNHQKFYQPLPGDGNGQLPDWCSRMPGTGQTKDSRMPGTGRTKTVSNARSVPSYARFMPVVRPEPGSEVSTKSKVQEVRGNGAPQKLFPRELKQAIKDQKDFLRQLEHGDDRRQAAEERLHELEVQQFNAPRTVGESLRKLSPEHAIPVNDIDRPSEDQHRVAALARQFGAEARKAIAQRE